MSLKSGAALLRGIVAFLLGAAGLLLVPAQAWAQCASTGTNQTCTNSGTIENLPTPSSTPAPTSSALSDNGTLTLTNTASGTIAGFTGVFATKAIITNYGLIIGTGFGSSGNGINITAGPSTITNYGTGIISAQGSYQGTGIQFASSGVTNTVINYGTIQGSGFSWTIANAGGTPNSPINVTNYGTIKDGAIGGFPSTVTNYGTISGSVVSNLGHTTIVNLGTISGSVGGATGIDVDNSGTMSQSISGNGYSSTIINRNGGMIGGVRRQII